MLKIRSRVVPERAESLFWTDWEQVAMFFHGSFLISSRSVCAVLTLAVGRGGAIRNFAKPKFVLRPGIVRF